MSKEPTELERTDEWPFAKAKPHWQCQSCGARDYTKPLPKDREKYYSNPKPGKCKKCKSDDLTPVGF